MSESEREAIEAAYRSGVISVLVCTSTLAAGINLPAGRVIINGMRLGLNGSIGIIQYKQMSGRAGRAGLISVQAESFLVVKTSERDKAMQLVNSAFPDVCSQMNPRLEFGSRGLMRAILELCSLGLCTCTESVKLYIRQTLLFEEIKLHQETINEILSLSLGALKFLLNAEILEPFHLFDQSKVDTYKLLINGAVTDDSLSFRLSKFGAATVSSNLNPDEAIIYYTDLLRALDSLNLETDLHVSFLCIPLANCLTPDFNKLFHAVSKAKDSKNVLSRVVAAIGIDDNTLFRWFQSPPSSEQISSCVDLLRQLKSSNRSVDTPLSVSTTGERNPPMMKRSSSEADLACLCRCKRLWSAYALVDLMTSNDPAAVAATYNMAMGDLQSLHRNSILLGSKMFDFAVQLGWNSLAQIIRNFHVRLANMDEAPPSELIEIMNIPGMSPRVALTLYGNYSLNTVQKISLANPQDVAQCLRLSVPFEVCLCFSYLIIYLLFI